MPQKVSKFLTLAKSKYNNVLYFTICIIGFIPFWQFYVIFLSLHMVPLEGASEWYTRPYAWTATYLFLHCQLQKTTFQLSHISDPLAKCGFLGTIRICTVIEVAFQVLHLNHSIYRIAAFSFTCRKYLSPPPTQGQYSRNTRFLSG